ncbi:hypothetical protein HFP72_31320 [Nocardiopsis sp. ARC36]
MGLSLSPITDDPDYFWHFLDPANHAPGIPIDAVSYHFYAAPALTDAVDSRPNAPSPPGTPPSSPRPTGSCARSASSSPSRSASVPTPAPTSTRSAASPPTSWPPSPTSPTSTGPWPGRSSPTCGPA